MNATFPYIILTNYVPLAHRGTAVGIIFTTTIVAQLVVAVGFGFVLRFVDDVAITIVMGGVCSIAAGFMSLILHMKDPTE